MPEEMKNAALSGECKIVPVAQLKKWHRDMDACQKVMWLRGGFDPAYCMDAQDCLKEMDSVLTTPVLPAGGEVKEIGGIDVAAASVLRFWAEDARNIRCVRAEDFDANVTRLQAENAALQQRLTIADQRVDDLETDLAAARELLKHGSSPTPAHCESVLDFLAGQSAPAAKGGHQYEDLPAVPLSETLDPKQAD